MRMRHAVARTLVCVLIGTSAFLLRMGQQVEPEDQEIASTEPTSVIEPAVITRDGVPVGQLPQPCSRIVLSRAYGELQASFPTASISHVSDWVYRYASARVREAHVILRDPVALGPWEAGWDPDLTEAKSDGSLTEWDHRYYVTHNWSYYGQIILDLQPGDHVTVNGVTVQVEGIFDYPKDSILDEILVLTGEDATVFQTCVPNEDYNRIVLAR